MRRPPLVNGDQTFENPSFIFLPFRLGTARQVALRFKKAELLICLVDGCVEGGQGEQLLEVRWARRAHEGSIFAQRRHDGVIYQVQNSDSDVEHPPVRRTRRKSSALAWRRRHVNSGA
jgi:hypothetical protein